MCGRISQYSDIREYVATLAMAGTLVNSVGEAPIERYNIALLHIQDDLLHADAVRWGWRPHWARDRAAPINARVEKVAHGPFFRAIWPYRAITPIDNWFEWVDEGGPKKQPYLIRRRDGAPVLCAAIGQLPGADKARASMTALLSSPPTALEVWWTFTTSPRGADAGPSPGMVGPSHAKRAC